MPAAHVKRALPGLSRELNEPRPDPGRFEDIPKIPTIAGDSKGLYVPLPRTKPSSDDYTSPVPLPLPPTTQN